MKFGIYTLDDFTLQGKTALCRLDLNSPFSEDGAGLKDATRIMRCLPTVEELSQKGAKVILLTHQGGDLEYKNYHSTNLHAAVISQALSRPVKFIDDVCGPAARESIKSLKNGEILMLDNVRYMAEELTLFETKLKLPFTSQAKTLVVRKLAPLADYFVCDAFAAAHRSQPTIVGLPQVLPGAMGRLFEEELEMLNKVAGEPKRPCTFILGGAKIQDAFIMMTTALKGGIADCVLTGGLVANIMLLAKGVPLGDPSKEFIIKNSLWDYVECAKDILKNYPQAVVMPLDLAFALEDRQEAELAELPSSYLLTDIGSGTIALYKKKIQESGTVFINGPMGVFEKEESSHGTREIWKAAAESKSFSLIGGGDSIRAANEFNVKNFSYVCTAGGALVRFLSGEELPAVKSLRQSADKFKI